MLEILFKWKSFMAYLFPAASVVVTKVASVTTWQNLHPMTDGPYGVPRTKA
jgi:hypothetical protein